jgi:hypothetical protein
MVERIDFVGCIGAYLELAPIGWKLFVLDHCANDHATFSCLVDAFATRLLAGPLRTFNLPPVLPVGL